jgi:hypothetical protein
VIRINYGLLVLQTVLAILALYHLGMGLLSVVSPRAAGKVAGSMYGIAVTENPQLRYAMRMLGLYALALGSLLLLATLNPSEFRVVIVVVAGLQLARAACRIILSRELTTAFDVSPGRNAISTVVLLAESVVLIVCLRYLPT